MVKKQLCQETQVLTINGTHIPINLEEKTDKTVSAVSLQFENNTRQQRAPVSTHSAAQEKLATLRTQWIWKLFLEMAEYSVSYFKITKYTKHCTSTKHKKKARQGGDGHFQNSILLL